jgi:outer membrane immunogenic protein
VLNKILAGIAAATATIVLTQSGFAADIAVKAGPMPVVAPAYNWTGIYVGLNAGGGWTGVDYLNTANTTAFGDVAGPPGFSDHADGFVGGGQIGFNWQAGNFVFGVEAMFDHSNMRGKVNPLRGAPPPFAQDDIFQTRIQSLFLGTARLGLAWDSALVYVKGGFAGGDVEVKVSDTVGITRGAGVSSDWRTGYTIGGGAEYGFRFAPGLSVALEYNFVRLDSASYELGTSAAPLLYTFNVATQDTHLVMGRLNYRFSQFGLLH